jgi:RNA polymerase sigma-70 factor (ECF subfamily)
LNLDSETRLVEAAQKGHLESFGALYERYHSSMVGLAYSLLADRNLAEDAAQEAFAIACHKLRELRRKDRFGAWLATICRNVVRTMLRAKGRTAALNLQKPPESQDNCEHYCDAIRRAVWNLRAADREVVVLRYYDNMSYEQIAQVLDISVQAVNGRLNRAKRKIAKYLKQTGFTPDDYGMP